MLNLEVIHVLFRADQIMNIYQLNKYVTCILMYKRNRGMLPNILNDVFMKQTPSHNYSMRQHNYSLQNTKLQNQCQTKHTHLYWSKTMECCYYEEEYWWLYQGYYSYRILDCTSVNILKKAMKQYIYLKRQWNNTSGEHINKKHWTIRIQWYNSV